ncbi:PLDc N-terminal domain-containing protein [Sphingobacterium sp. JUb56]|uniref:PLDc N-terminal domain-containing protein n=1 Tax=Sphingobacterium sp. JUb56 TaxID=2587145 RepID=UPI001622CB0C|nr:PLD nuclease N-terminal domain-containing protein [Sphingobacterium sp. JUb56]MBB2949422.1 putative membrane channel-forming protein YqfA (hemolysin III family) [Sphingobacterium sp. JUb56]
MNLSLINIGTTEMLYLLVPILLVVYTIYHIITNDNIPGDKRILWIVAVLLFNVIGCIFYWWFGKDKSNNI